ncbi:MAG: hypothetical protein M3Y82_03050 [Verrucomicrobiota bacterium]|nr:hypothetical protein [Verrucomicrobiota bacterium]
MKINTKFFQIKFTLLLIAVLTSLVWAGCSSTRSDADRDAMGQPPDLTKRRPNTHPEWQSGLPTTEQNVRTVPGKVTKSSERDLENYKRELDELKDVEKK